MANRFLNNIRINDSYTFPSTDGSNGQAIITDGAGNLTFGSAIASSADSAESVHISVKNTSGAQILKGTPVYVTGETGNSGKIEVAPADASDSAKMPALGLLESTLSNNGEGFCVQGGLLEGLATATIDGTATTANDNVYVKPGGGLTMTKPTGTGLIQNIAKVARAHASNGTLVVSSILRTNDVPNLTTGKIWVGDGNTVESTVVHLDEFSGRMGIGTDSPEYRLDVSGTTRSNEFISQSEALEVAYIANLGGTNNIGGSGFGSASFAGGEDNEAYGWKSIANGTRNRIGFNGLFGGGDNSAVFGSNNVAMGYNAAAFGVNNVVQGSGSIALGRTNLSSGVASVAAGDGVIASGNHSFACNINNTASGDGAIAGGFDTVASGGYAVSLGINTTATGWASFAMGDNCDATAGRAFATGLNSVASGQSAVVHGNNNVASGTNSFVSGANSTVSGFNSAALGNNLNVTSGAGTAVGVWNLDTGFYKFQVGVGTSELDRKNAFSVSGAGVIIAHVLAESDSYANDSQAGAGGVPVGGLYRNGSIVQIRIT